MNDFTKSELEDILNWAWCYTDFGHSWVTEMHKPLMEKIESMIDGYCEEIRDINSINACPKCGKHHE